MSHSSRPPDGEHAFRSLYEAIYPDLLRFAQRRAHPDRAEDVVAEALLVVWRRLDELPRTHEDARAWAFGIARNVLLNDHRGEQRRRSLGVRLAEAAALPPSVADGQALASLVDLGRAWRLLTEAHQEAIALTVLEGLDAPRAAAVVGISPVAFRLRLSRARRALRTHVDGLPPRAAPPRRTAPTRTAPSPRTAERTTAP